MLDISSFIDIFDQIDYYLLWQGYDTFIGNEGKNKGMNRFNGKVRTFHNQLEKSRFFLWLPHLIEINQIVDLVKKEF